MTRLLDRFLGGDTERHQVQTLDDLSDWFGYNGWRYPLLGQSNTGSENLEHSFTGYVDAALKSNGIVFACVVARLMLFSEVRFAWRNVADGNVFGRTGLEPLENPGAGRTTQEMLALCEMDVSFAGNSYWVRDGAGVRRLRPDWVGIVTGSPDAGQRSSDLLGYTFTDGGPGSQTEPEVFTPGQVAHFSPIPDPSAHYRGMSWITPVVQDVQADSRFTRHRSNLAKEGGIHTFAVQYPMMTKDDFSAAVTSFRDKYEGPDSSGKSIHISGGADITPLQMDLRALDFKNVQGGGETRIAAAARVPAVIAGISEGLSGSSLNMGNYGMARRMFGDGFARPSWRSLCGAFGNLVTPPAGTNELWYDDTDIAFLLEDRKDAAEVFRLTAEAARTLIDGGMEPKSAIDAANSLDISKLRHTGFVSVQLQPPGLTADTNAATTTAEPPEEDTTDE